jgi:branched-chain amino acid transport system permease protein
MSNDAMTAPPSAKSLPASTIDTYANTHASTHASTNARSAALRRSESRSAWLVVATMAALFVLPYLFPGAQSLWSTCVTVAIFAVMAYGVDIIFSYLGEVSLGHTVFWAAGGYTVGYGTVHLGLGPMATAAATVAVSLVIAVALGLATLRSREFMFSLVTYASAIVIHEVVFNTSALGGSEGLPGVPPLTLSLFGLTYNADSDRGIWPIAFALLSAAIYLVARFRRSRLGRAALMAHMNPDLATSLGIDVRRTRLAVFVLSAPVTALAGCLYAYQRAYVGPDMFDNYFLILMLSAVVLFGQRLLLGPLLGATVLLIQEKFFSVGGDGDKIIVGAILIAILLLMPQGLARTWMKRGRRS